MFLSDIVVVTIPCLTLLTLGWLHYQKHAKVNLDDYINALDHEYWKSRDDIQDQMEEEHHGWLDTYELIKSLIILERNGQILHRIVPHVTAQGVTDVHEFKRDFGSGDGSDNASSPLPPSPCHGMKIPSDLSKIKIPQSHAGFFII